MTTPGPAPLLVTKHERCVCGHCRCAHQDGYGGCEKAKCSCIRYTWPGRGSELAADHRR